MVAKKYWKKSIIEFINITEKEKEIKFSKIMYHLFEIHPKVFSPIYSSDTAWFAKKIVSLIPNKKFLEIGSGSGIIACTAAIYGAKTVVATDISIHAINNILANAKLLLCQ